MTTHYGLWSRSGQSIGSDDARIRWFEIGTDGRTAIGYQYSIEFNNIIELGISASRAPYAKIYGRTGTARTALYQMPQQPAPHSVAPDLLKRLHDRDGTTKTDSHLGIIEAYTLQGSRQIMHFLKM